MKKDFKDLERVIILAVVVVGLVALYTIREQGDKIDALEQQLKISEDRSISSDMDLWWMMAGDEKYWNIINEMDVPYCNTKNILISGLHIWNDSIQINYNNPAQNHAMVIYTNGTKYYFNTNEQLFASDFCQLIGEKTW